MGALEAPGGHSRALEPGEHAQTIDRVRRALVGVSVNAPLRVEQRPEQRLRALELPAQQKGVCEVVRGLERVGVLGRARASALRAFLQSTAVRNAFGVLAPPFSVMNR